MGEEYDKEEQAEESESEVEHVDAVLEVLSPQVQHTSRHLTCQYDINDRFEAYGQPVSGGAAAVLPCDDDHVEEDEDDVDEEAGDCVLQSIADSDEVLQASQLAGWGNEDGIGRAVDQHRGEK